LQLLDQTSHVWYWQSHALWNWTREWDSGHVGDVGVAVGPGELDTGTGGHYYRIIRIVSYRITRIVGRCPTLT